MITNHQRYRRTDRQTSCDRKTALCTKVHCAVKIPIRLLSNRIIKDLPYPSHDELVIPNTSILKYRNWFTAVAFSFSCTVVLGLDENAGQRAWDLGFRTSFYRAMHFSANARSCDRMSSVCLSVTLVICDHIGWKSWKLIARTISPNLCSL